MQYHALSLAAPHRRVLFMGYRGRFRESPAAAATTATAAAAFSSLLGDGRRPRHLGVVGVLPDLDLPRSADSASAIHEPLRMQELAYLLEACVALGVVAGQHLDEQCMHRDLLPIHASQHLHLCALHIEAPPASNADKTRKEVSATHLSLNHIKQSSSQPSN